MVRNGQAYPRTPAWAIPHHDGQRTRRARLGGRGIEAGQPCSANRSASLIPRVVGFKLTGSLPAGAARPTWFSPSPRCCEHGVVGKFVEFYGEGVAAVPLANRADRQQTPSTARRWRSSRSTTDPDYPADDRSQRTADRGRQAYAQAQGMAPSRQQAGLLRMPGTGPGNRRPAWPGRSGRRTGSPWTRQQRNSPLDLPTYTDAPGCHGQPGEQDVPSATARWSS